MKARLLARGVPEDRIRICENWADGDAVRPAALWPDPLPLRVLYSGNLGMAHDVDTMQSVMSSFREDNRLEFIYAGSGPRRKELELACAGFPFVTFLPWAERTSLGDSLGSAHIGLVTQRAETIGTVVPSKIYGLLAAGRPLLYIGPAASTAAMVIRRHNCGWHFECGDEAGVRALLERLLREPELIRIAGASARRALESEYDYKIGVARVVEVVLSQARQNL
jgi:colanic acid biosynthesis glycosyl transferase WcaI